MFHVERGRMRDGRTGPPSVQVAAPPRVVLAGGRPSVTTSDRRRGGSGWASSCSTWNTSELGTRVDRGVFVQVARLHGGRLGGAGTSAAASRPGEPAPRLSWRCSTWNRPGLQRRGRGAFARVAVLPGSLGGSGRRPMAARNALSGPSCSTWNSSVSGAGCRVATASVRAPTTPGALTSAPARSGRSDVDARPRSSRGLRGERSPRLPRSSRWEGDGDPRHAGGRRGASGDDRSWTPLEEGRCLGNGGAAPAPRSPPAGDW
jgi:hypothetical protein